MNVRQLIAKLESMPLNAQVTYVWDGAPRGKAELVWLARCGDVVVADYGEYVSDPNQRPEYAPMKGYWESMACDHPGVE